MAAHDRPRDTLDRAEAVLRRKQRSGTPTDRTIRSSRRYLSTRRRSSERDVEKV